MSYVPHSLARILDEIERLKHVRAGPVFKELLYGPGTYEMWDTYLFQRQVHAGFLSHLS